MACPKSRFYETFYMTPYQKVLKIKFIKIGQKILFGLILLELQIFFFIHTTQDYLIILWLYPFCSDSYPLFNVCAVPGNSA